MDAARTAVATRGDAAGEALPKSEARLVHQTVGRDALAEPAPGPLRLGVALQGDGPVRARPDL